jgi:ABC-type uncharacterized transport system substrate-binding protein
VIDYRFADSNLDRLPDLATELARLRADVIVAGANAAVIAAKTATRTIPIVMFLTFDPVGWRRQFYANSRRAAESAPVALAVGVGTGLFSAS